jgi:high-affinity K+ transport system ATPase subunit B
MVTENSLKNLKLFEKGNKGGGRPKGSLSIVRILHKTLAKKINMTDKNTKELSKKTIAEGVVLALIQKAMKGDVSAIKEVLERTDGKVTQKTDMHVKEQGTVHIYIPDNGRGET